MKLFKRNYYFKKNEDNSFRLNIYHHNVSNMNVNRKVKQIDKLNIKKIINTYQLENKTRGNSFGLGDFIRGSFCLLQICNKYGLKFDIDVSNHPMSNYVEGHIKNPNINYNEIESLFDTTQDRIKDYKLFMQIFKKKNTETYYTCSNGFLPFEIKQSEIEFIKNRFLPNELMKTLIDEEMNALNLISKQFFVIHIRSGDNYLVKNNILLQSWAEKIFAMLNPILNNKTNKYLILSDSNQLKELFKKYDNCVVQIKPITHLGEHLQLKDEEVKNTMLDFYLMSHSKYIYAITVYEHGTGFSKWCSVVYNIPYNIKLIEYPM